MADILIISGSPSKRNCEQAQKEVHEIAKKEGFKLDSVFLSETKTFPCVDCNHCKEKHVCIEPFVNKTNEKLSQARAIIIISPVYFGSVPAQLKALFDRTRPLRRNNMQLKDKIGAAIAIGGSRNGGQEMTIQTIHSWMHIQGMMVVGNNSHFGGTLTAPITEDDDGMKTLVETTKKVCDTLRMLR